MSIRDDTDIAPQQQDTLRKARGLDASGIIFVEAG